LLPLFELLFQGLAQFLADWGKISARPKATV